MTCTFSYAYDQCWRQTSAYSSLGGCHASSATYNALDAPTAWTYGNSLAQSFTYDVLGRVDTLKVGGGSVLNLGYTYDNVGNVATNTDTLNSQTQNYAYDHRDRLTHAWTTGSGTAAYDEGYTYNAIGNLTGKGPTGSLATYGYNASGSGSVRPHAATAVGSDVYAYDGNGNLTSRTGKTITWNVDNTVASVVGPDNVPEGYSYDVNGQRVTRSRNLGQPGGFTTVYCGGLYEEDTPSGDKRLLYTFAGRVVAQRTIVGGSGTGTVAYLHGDLLGSTGATTSSGGGVTATQRYAPFGSVRAGGSLPTTIGFTGQRQDGTELSYYNARYYDPAIGRFASADDIGVDRANPQTRNRYSYVANNPLKYTDPTGHCGVVNSNASEQAQAAQQRENDACYDYIRRLYAYGVHVSLEFFANWLSSELALVLETIGDWMRAAGWDDPGYFKGAMGGRVWLDRIKGPGESYEARGVIYFYDSIFDSQKSKTGTKFDIAHEFAHRWDEASSIFDFIGGHSQGLMEATHGSQSWWCFPGDNCSTVDGNGRYQQGSPSGAPSGYSKHNRWEDFAESVAATIYGVEPEEERAGYGGFAGSTRHCYVQTLFAEAVGRQSGC